MDWHHAQMDRSEELAQHYFFSMKKREQGREVQFRITVREFASPPPGQNLRFFAQADKQINQNTAAFLPSGWGDSVLQALADCLRLIRQFPYEGSEQG
jgi:hypothetical protein